MKTINAHQRYLDRAAAAEYICVSPKTLANWAVDQRHNLPFAKLGGKVVYKISDLDLFVEKRLINKDCDD
ncbi:helix-turn-helix domain-containing protein [Vibrio sp. JC009]|nr:helix-turn-helix domain-containing protein [Vibrio sp. JC009]WED21486.1 helix-turn-helix domain-containing protein [Vibrio sp. JC009]